MSHRHKLPCTRWDAICRVRWGLDWAAVHVLILIIIRKSCDPVRVNGNNSVCAALLSLTEDAAGWREVLSLLKRDYSGNRGLVEDSSISTTVEPFVCQKLLHIGYSCTR